jgi:hypothetical protein
VHDRTALGLAEVSDGELSAMVATLLGQEPADVTLLDSYAEPVSYDLPAITTAGRYWVRGGAQTPVGATPFELFVKHVQSWGRSPLFADVPEEVREMAEASVPWRTEPLLYRSGIAQHLPAGLTMPRALGVFDLDEKAASIWLEVVPAYDVEWDLPRFTRAAYLLGRLAWSPAVRDFADVGGHDWDIRQYLYGRLANQVLPVLRSDEVWQHPIIEPAFDPGLRARLLEAADRVEGYVEELMRLPSGTGHGDACPNNLLVVDPASPDFVLIDFGFWQPQPVGFDLSQLLVGDVQIGRRSTDDLRQRDEACLAAYVEGLRAEGSTVSDADVRRAHALQLLIFTGLSTLPMEHLEEAPTPELVRMSQERAAIARFSLDLVDATS